MCGCLLPPPSGRRICADGRYAVLGGASYSIEHESKIYRLRSVAMTALAFNDLRVYASNNLNKGMSKAMNKESQD